MNALTTATTGLLLAAVPVLAHADDMSYRYIQLNYINTDGEFGRPDAKGFATRGSIGFAKNYFVFTELSRQTLSVSGPNVDIDQYAVGLGGHYGLSDQLDLVGRAGWTKVKVSGDDQIGSETMNFEDDGYLVALGLRGHFGEHFQLEGGVIHQDFGGGNDDTGAEVLARYHFNKHFALAVEYQISDDVSSFLAGVRFSF